MGFLDKSINELINREYPCSCGKTHIAKIENIAIGVHALQKLPGGQRCEYASGRREKSI